MTAKFIPIRLSALYYDQGVHHPDLLGAFVHNQLTLCRTADGAGDMVEWKRHAGESPSAFEERIIGDLLELMRVTRQSSNDSERQPSERPQMAFAK